MTTAQPGQEQRMELAALLKEPSKEMLSAGMAAAEECKDSDWDSGPDGEGHNSYEYLRSDAAATIFAAMVRVALDQAARPTADLGDDGELVAALWSYAHDLKVAVPLRQAMEDARDRLILYMEALVKADKCGSCDRPRSSYCATCERDWQS